MDLVCYGGGKEDYEPDLGFSGRSKCRQGGEGLNVLHPAFIPSAKFRDVCWPNGHLNTLAGTVNMANMIAVPQPFPKFFIFHKETSKAVVCF